MAMHMLVDLSFQNNRTYGTARIRTTTQEESNGQ